MSGPSEPRSVDFPTSRGAAGGVGLASDGPPSAFHACGQAESSATNFATRGRQTSGSGVSLTTSCHEHRADLRTHPLSWRMRSPLISKERAHSAVLSQTGRVPDSHREDSVHETALAPTLTPRGHLVLARVAGAPALPAD